jgi:hypothetical protein
MLYLDSQLKSKLVLSLSIMAILFSAMLISLVNASNTEVIKVDASSEQTRSFDLEVGQHLTGSFTISGGSRNDIDFWVTDDIGSFYPGYGSGYGDVQQGRDRVDQGESFDILVVLRMPTLHFGNTFSSSPKTINLTCDISSPRTIWGINTGLLTIIIAAVVFFALLILGLALRRRDRGSETKPSHVAKDPGSLDILVNLHSLVLFCARTNI